MLEASVFTLPGSEENGGLLNALVRFSLASADSGSTPPYDRPRVRLSLLLLHGTAYHKEAWIPVLEQLVDLQRATPTCAYTIVEVWCMDMPNHGRAAILNEHRLLEFPDGLTGAQCAREVNVFLKSGLIASGCSVVAIGHSAGSCILIQSTEDYAVNQLPFSSLIMVEPPMMTPDRLREEIKKGATFLRAIDVARVRKDIWPSRATAKEWFAKRLPWKRWDPRSLDLFIEHGLRDLPTAAYPELQEGVTLTTPREQEAGCYSAYDDAHISMERLKAICHAIPVHCVFSGINDMMSIEAQKDMVDERVGRRMRSVVRVTGAGHLVLQEKPRELALAIWGILHEDYAQRVHLVKARL